MAIIPFSCIKSAFAVIDEVASRIGKIAKNNAHRQRIECYITKLKDVANELSELKEDNMPPSCEGIISSFKDSIRQCQSICNARDKQGNVVKFVCAGTHFDELHTLESELQKATANLQLVIELMNHAKLQKAEEARQRDTRELKRDVIAPSQGLYVPSQKDAKDRPAVVQEPTVEVDEAGDLMVVKWKDDNSKNVVEYQIQWDDANDFMASKPVADCRVPSSTNNFMIWLPSNNNEFMMKIGYPKVQPGHLYSVRVRGINGAGPGKWSDTKIFRFKTGPPNKPKMPTASPVSPTEVAITVCRLPKEDEHGSPVTKCIVEYVIMDFETEYTWNSCVYNMPGGSEVPRIKVGSLNPDTRYCFRVKMKNDVGESKPSDYTVVVTNQFKPGPPQEVRLSSKRTSTTLKLRWKEPAVNPKAACAYNVQIRRAKRLQDWETYRIESFSFKFVGLTTNTQYLFRVQSVNNKGEVSDWSWEIEGETRIHKAACAAAAIATGIGCTIAGPVIGPVIGASVGGQIGAEIASEEGAKGVKKLATAAGISVGGALLGTVAIGPALGYIVYKEMAGGNYVDLTESPQTSDDEDTNK